jgi:hypothetical protein
MPAETSFGRAALAAADGEHEDEAERPEHPAGLACSRPFPELSGYFLSIFSAWFQLPVFAPYSTQMTQSGSR